MLLLLVLIAQAAELTYQLVHCLLRSMQTNTADLTQIQQQQHLKCGAEQLVVLQKLLQL
jgi:hypothetical protein